MINEQMPSISIISVSTDINDYTHLLKVKGAQTEAKNKTPLNIIYKGDI